MSMFNFNKMKSQWWIQKLQHQALVGNSQAMSKNEIIIVMSHMVVHI